METLKPSPFNRLNDISLGTLHRHWIWCDLMRRHFYDALASRPKQVINKPNLAEPNWAYMLLWYGLLYSILETLKNWQIKILKLDDDIKELYQELKDCRNAVFHPQPDYYSIKLFRIMIKKDTSKKILKIHESLGDFFLDEIGVRNLAREASS